MKLTKVTRYVDESGREFRSKIDAEQAHAGDALNKAINDCCAYDQMDSGRVFEFIQNERALIQDYYRLCDAMMAEVMRPKRSQ